MEHNIQKMGVRSPGERAEERRAKYEASLQEPVNPEGGDAGESGDPSVTPVTEEDAATVAGDEGGDVGESEASGDDSTTSTEEASDTEGGIE